MMRIEDSTGIPTGANVTLIIASWMAMQVFSPHEHATLHIAHASIIGADMAEPSLEIKLYGTARQPWPHSQQRPLIHRPQGSRVRHDDFVRAYVTQAGAVVGVTFRTIVLARERTRWRVRLRLHGEFLLVQLGVTPITEEFVVEYTFLARSVECRHDDLQC